MNAAQFTDSELDAYLDEALPASVMSAVESALRNDQQLTQRLAEILQRRDHGLHSLGEIWRRHRLSCPTREELGSFLLEVLSAEHAGYIRFHVETLGCRICGANLNDLQDQVVAGREAEQQQRRRQYFQSSVGYLRKPLK